MITGITRVRNESLILEDTLAHFLGYCDHIHLYDDCSTDNTVEIASGFDAVTVIRGDEWRKDRIAENTRHRALLLEKVEGWCLCFDADERIVGGDFPDVEADAYTFRLFDGYLTQDAGPYVGGKLADLPRMWGPEYRDIAMLFHKDKAKYDRRGQREPTIKGRVEHSGVFVKHYGKCLSVEHWEETCRYYADNFPQWRAKWNARKGKAIHKQSDFGRPLYEWDDAVKNGVPI